MDIQVGDRVTYKIREIVFTEIINNFSWGVKLKNDATYEILKIERPKYEVVEEKKELLTDKEKEFLNDMCKYYGIERIRFKDNDIDFFEGYEHIANCSDYPKNMNFKNIERYKNYTLKELGLEED